MGVVLNWSSGYPGVVDSIVVNFPTVADNTHDVLASHVNELAIAVVALETAVGGFRTNVVADPLSPLDREVLTYNGTTTEWESSNEAQFSRRVISAGITVTVPDELQHLVSGVLVIEAGGLLAIEAGGEVVII